MSGIRARGVGTAVIFALAALTACRRDVTPIEIAAPLEVSHLVIVELDGRGELLTASPLLPFGAGEPVWFDPTDADVTVLGFGSAALRELGDPLPAEATTEAVALASACGPAFPAPIWAARRLESAVSELALAEVPALTARWLDGRCAFPLMGELDLDIRCAFPRCATRIQSSSPCGAVIETSGCGFGTLDLGFSGGRARCTEVQDSSWACKPAGGSRDGRVVLDCTSDQIGALPSCAVEVIPRSRREVPPFSATTIPFAPGGFKEGPDPEPRIDINDERFRWGHGLDLVALEDHVVVLRADGLERCPAVTAMGTPIRRFDFVALDGTAVARTSTAPGCLDRLAREIGGPGFVGITGADDGSAVMARFDPEGRPIQVRRFDLAGAYPTDLVALDTVYAIRMARFFVDAQGQPRTQGEVLFLDTRFTPVSSYVPRGGPARLGNLYAVASLPDHVFVRELYDRLASAEAAVVRGSDGARTSGLWNFPGLTTTAYAIEDRLFVGTGHDGVARLDLPDLVSRGSFAPVGALGHVISLAVWPAGATPLLIAGGAGRRPDDRALEAEVFFIDPSADRFLAGRTVVGRGPVSQVAVDVRGQVWLLLPWAGELVRLRPE